MSREPAPAMCQQPAVESALPDSAVRRGFAVRRSRARSVAAVAAPADSEQTQSTRSH